MSSINQQKITEIYTFLSKNLGMKLFSSNESNDVYRKQIKEHIVTIQINKVSSVGTPDIKTFLNIDGMNVWWHTHALHSGYTLDNLIDFDNIEFVRIISRHSEVFKYDWISFADI